MEVTQRALSSMRCSWKSTKSTNKTEKSSRNEAGKKTEMENQVEMTQGKERAVWVGEGGEGELDISGIGC